MSNVVYHIKKLCKKGAWSPGQFWKLVGPETYNQLCTALYSSISSSNIVCGGIERCQYNKNCMPGKVCVVGHHYHLKTSPSAGDVARVQHLFCMLIQFIQ